MVVVVTTDGPPAEGAEGDVAADIPSFGGASHGGRQEQADEANHRLKRCRRIFRRCRK